MAWIRTIEREEAEGLLRREYEAAVKRAGRVYNVVKLFSLNPEALRATIGLYTAAMHGASELSRAQREMIATVVSKLNGCHY